MKKGAEDAFRSARKRTKAFKKRDCKSVFSLVPREIRDGKKAEILRPLLRFVQSAWKTLFHAGKKIGFSLMTKRG